MPDTLWGWIDAIITVISFVYMFRPNVNPRPRKQTREGFRMTRIGGLYERIEYFRDDDIQS